METDVAVVIEDAEVHGSGMEIDAAVESVLLGIESHGGLLSWLVPNFNGQEEWLPAEREASMRIDALKLTSALVTALALVL
jgi:hypothetical protein